MSNLEIVEINIKDGTILVRWDEPMAPLHGEIESYKVTFCYEKEECEKQYFDVQPDEFCTLWDSNRTLCKTLPMPKTDYDRIRVRLKL